MRSKREVKAPVRLSPSPAKVKRVPVFKKAAIKPRRHRQVNVATEKPVEKVKETFVQKNEFDLDHVLLVKEWLLKGAWAPKTKQRHETSAKSWHTWAQRSGLSSIPTEVNLISIHISPPLIVKKMADWTSRQRICPPRK